MGNENQNDLWSIVEGLTDEELNKKGQDGSWSIAQILEHLLLTDLYVLKEMEENLKKIEAKEKPVHYTVNRSHKVQAPKELEPSNEYQTLASLKDKMTVSRLALENKIRQFSEDDLTEHSLHHFIFGMVSLKQWLPFINYHEKRHIEQIQEIKRTLV